MANPRITIIMNTRNGEAFLREALDSVMMQTFADWELILWDDNSTDSTRSIAEVYTDPRVRRLYCDEDVHLGVARDRAVKEARGEWLAFLDQDDVWTADKLSRQIELVEDGVGLIYGRTVCLRGKTIGPDADHKHEHRPLPEGKILRSLLIDSCYITMSAAMLRTEAVHALGRVPDEIEVTPDYHWFLAIAEQWESRAVQDTICLYRLHQSSMTASHGLRLHEEILHLLTQWGQHIEPAQLARRLRVHESHIALINIRYEHRFFAGLARLLSHGSAAYIFSRPFIRVARSIRRTLRRPEWRRAPDRIHATHERASVVGTLVTPQDFSGAVASLEHMVEKRSAGYISASNAYGVGFARGDPRYRALLNNAQMVTADGMPIVWMLNRLGHPSERVHNDDLVLAACKRNPGWRLALVGGREGQPETVGNALIERCPGIEILATFATPQRPVPREQSVEIVNTLRDTPPDLVLVGMGTPAQDEWMSAVYREIGVPMIGCGSLFDLLNGRTRPAPAWMKRAGLQWLFRLLQEPRRLAGRYAVYNTLFIIAAVHQLLASRAAPTHED